jgi:hypothetical protein
VNWIRAGLPHTKFKLSIYLRLRALWHRYQDVTVTWISISLLGETNTKKYGALKVPNFCTISAQFT